MSDRTAKSQRELTNQADLTAARDLLRRRFNEDAMSDYLVIYPILEELLVLPEPERCVSLAALIRAAIPGVDADALIVLCNCAPNLQGFAITAKTLKEEAGAILGAQRGTAYHVRSVEDFMKNQLAEALDKALRAGQVPLRTSAPNDSIAPTRPLVRMFPEGRLPMAEKLERMLRAKNEIIEFGVGLTAFASYFDLHRSSLWKDPLIGLMRSGVDIRCYALDLEWEPAKGFLFDRGEHDDPGARERIFRTLRAVDEAVGPGEAHGRLSISTYRHVPTIYAQIIDPQSSQASAVVAPYLYGLARQQSPVIECTLREHPELFRSFAESVWLATAPSV
jgi:hypothetical protein